ncbi:hypothetical protein [Brevundimonas sp.]|uniref:hypothetical protein n=1 Tax=Brevundimonas sp. TaxID=1871086 RepID=UPI001D813E4A|nr:hypothetical protein [Brevundimonas sp.]MBA4000159.1 hypothetical protein [Brevundimonas sp.]
MSRTFTREEFYELVWSKPMTQLANEFALSDVALHKICRKHGIPNPPLGWWAKKAAGKPVERTPLPPLTSGDRARTITIAEGHLKPEPEAMAAVREKARLLASSIEAEAETPSHAVVTETLRALRNAGPPTLQGLVSVSGPGRVKVEVSPGSFDRVELILGRLAAAGDTLDVELAADESGAFLKHQGEMIRFSISESYRRHKHAPTEIEQAQLNAWKKKHDKALRRGGWDVVMLPDLPRLPEWDYVPTGQLSLEMQAPCLYGVSPRRSFRDAKIQRLEKMTGDILVGVHVLAAAMQEDRLRREAADRQRREAEERRERALRERHVCERRNAALDHLLQEIGELDRLRRLLTALHGELGDRPSGRVGEFMAFAELRLHENEQALRATGLSSRFESERLFGDDDDHDFRPPVSRY